MRETAVCVRCLRRPAVFHSGHVLDRRKRLVLAGWCNPCRRIARYNGFVGHLRREMRPRKVEE
jgi:hypothetical protein